MCGSNEYGQRGTDASYDTITTWSNDNPHRLLGVGPSSDSLFIFLADGSLLAAGRNDNGQLGVGDKIDRNEFTYVNFGTYVDVKQLSVSSDRTLCRADIVDNFAEDLTETNPSPSMIAHSESLDSTVKPKFSTASKQTSGRGLLEMSIKEGMNSELLHSIAKSVASSEPILGAAGEDDEIS